MDKYNFSDVMLKVSNIYKSRIYIDDIDFRQDSYICPQCKDVVTYSNCGGRIEKEFDKYICPLCGEKF